MAFRIGTGPVFTYELCRSSRSWRLHATRSLFVVSILISLIAAWATEVEDRLHSPSLAMLARVGEKFYYATVGTQLALVLLLAPALTAGSITTEKMRGTLMHLLVTDLSSAEIILGKLAARLLPVLALVTSSMPILFSALILGGIEPAALLGAYLITIGVAILGCALALLLSVWGNTIREVLLPVYLVWALVLLVSPSWRYLNGKALAGAPPAWLERIDPFLAAFAPYQRLGPVDLSESAWYLVGTIALSSLLVGTAVWRVRSAALDRFSRPASKHSSLAIKLSCCLRSLERNPVLWLGWSRPSWLSRLVWPVYGLGAATFTVIALATYARGRGPFAAWVNGVQVAVGLLLVTVVAGTSLADERSRGTLDVLLATPLSARGLVWRKWRQSFRPVPLLVVLPGMLSFLLASDGEFKWPLAVAMVGLILAYGAVLTSLGLLIAERYEQFGRALAVSFTAYGLLTVGWLILVGCLPFADDLGLRLASPFFGPCRLTAEVTKPYADEHLVSAVFWALIHAFFARRLYAVSVASFDQCLGRMPE